MDRIIIGTGNPACPVTAFPAPYHDIAVAFVRMLTGNITPEQFLNAVMVLSPETIENAKALVALCVGVSH